MCDEEAERVSWWMDTAPQRPRTTSSPDSTSSSLALGSFPVRSVKSVLSNVTIWETLAMDSFESPVAPGGSRTFPGAVPLHVACQGNTHDRRDSAAVQRISLYDDHRTSEPWAGPRRPREVCPPDVTLGDAHQSLRSRMRRDAARANLSTRWSISVSARSIASVTRSGA